MTAVCLPIFVLTLNFFPPLERPGIVERSTFLMDEDDLTCRVHDVTIAEDGLVGAASIMMFITVAYIGIGTKENCRGNLQGWGEKIEVSLIECNIFPDNLDEICLPSEFGI